MTVQMAGLCFLFGQFDLFVRVSSEAYVSFCEFFLSVVNATYLRQTEFVLVSSYSLFLIQCQLFALVSNLFLFPAWVVCSCISASFLFLYPVRVVSTCIRYELSVLVSSLSCLFLHPV